MCLAAAVVPDAAYAPMGLGRAKHCQHLTQKHLHLPYLRAAMRAVPLAVKVREVRQGVQPPRRARNYIPTLGATIITTESSYTLSVQHLCGGAGGAAPAAAGGAGPPAPIQRSDKDTKQHKTNT
jgi:hypothetical protein